MALLALGGIGKRGYEELCWVASRRQPPLPAHSTAARSGSTLPISQRAGPVAASRFTDVLQGAETLERMAIRNPRMLTSLIKQADSATTVLTTLRDEVTDCNSIHVSIALHQLALNRRDLTAGDVESPTFVALVDRAAELCDKRACGVREAVNIIWSIATMRKEAPQLLELLPAVIDIIPDLLTSMTAQQLATACWAIATIYAQEPHAEVSDRLLALGQTLLGSLEAQVVAMKAQEVANTVWSISMFQTVAPQATQYTSVFADAAAKMLADDQYQLFDRTLRLLTHARLLWGLAALNHSDDRLLALIARDVLKRAPTARGRDLYSLIDITCAFARLGFQDMQVLEVAVRRLSTLRMHLLRDWDVCALSWSLNTLCATELFEEFREGLQSEITKRGIPLSQVERSRFGPESWNPAAQMQSQG